MPEDQFYPAAILQGSPAKQGVRNLRNPDVFFEQFDRLYNDFRIVINNVEDNRMNRNLLIDVKSQQAQGKFAPDETYIAQRVIDINIAREMPAHIAYLTTSRRIAIFQPKVYNPDLQTDILEMEFMKLLTYQNWINDYERLVDGAKLNGFDFVDVCYDPSFPGHVSVEHIGTDNLIFDIRVKCIQQSPIVARTYEITLVDLFEFHDSYGFDEKVTNELAQKIQSSSTSYAQTLYEANRIYRVFFKQEGKVYAGWYTKELKKFLRAPDIFYNGVSEQYQSLELVPGDPSFMPQPIMKWRPVGETDYPFYVYVNRMTENKRIADTMGRADIDFYRQEAASTIWSALVNTCTRASNTMWSPENPNPEVGAAPKQLNMVIGNGKIWNNPMKAFNAPWPDPMIAKVLEMMETQNSTDNNQVAYAVNNKKDTRKTATEIDAAQEQQTVMSSVTVTLFSTALRDIFTACWRIMQSEALQGRIQFAGNDPQIIGQEFEIIPAGSVDYVQRQEQIQQMQTDFPIIGTTAAGPTFLIEYIKKKYPEIADKLIAPIQQAQMQAANAIPAYQELLKAAVQGPDGKLDPEWEPQRDLLAKLGALPGTPASPPPVAGQPGMPAGQTGGQTGGQAPTGQSAPAQPKQPQKP